MPNWFKRKLRMDTQYQRGLVLAQSGKLDEARKEIKKVYQSGKKTKQVRYQLALLYFRIFDERGKKKDLYQATYLEIEDYDPNYHNKVERARGLKQNIIDFGSDK